MVKLRKGYSIDKNGYEIDEHGFATGRRLVTKKVKVSHSLSLASVVPKRDLKLELSILKRRYKHIKSKKMFSNPNSNQYGIYVGQLRRLQS